MTAIGPVFATPMIRYDRDWNGCAGTAVQTAAAPVQSSIRFAFDNRKRVRIKL
jgi:hypothetical protein